jgi:hypothetical protein
MSSTSRSPGGPKLFRREAFTRRHARPGCRPGQKLLAEVAVVLGLTAGCGHGSTADLPTKRAPSVGRLETRSASPPMSPKDIASAAYAASFAAVNEALQSPPERIRSILSNYMTGEFLDFQIRQLLDEQARHLEPWGRVVVHITTVDIQQDRATIHDCQDASNAGLADAQTHQLVPELRGVAHRNLTAKLTLGGDGRWRVSNLTQFKGGCHVS